MELFTVLVGFTDHTIGVGQYTAPSPMDALKKSIQESEAFIEYDRALVIKAISTLVHTADMKGVWLAVFSPLAPGLEGEYDNPILGATIIQTDPNAPVRESDQK